MVPSACHRETDEIFTKHDRPINACFIRFCLWSSLVAASLRDGFELLFLGAFSVADAAPAVTLTSTSEVFTLYVTFNPSRMFVYGL
jgi:hypothetical protein